MARRPLILTLALGCTLLAGCKCCRRPPPPADCPPAGSFNINKNPFTLYDPEHQQVGLAKLHELGFEIANRFAIGYGLDHAQHYRNLDYVAALDE